MEHLIDKHFSQLVFTWPGDPKMKPLCHFLPICGSLPNQQQKISQTVPEPGHLEGQGSQGWLEENEASVCLFYEIELAGNFVDFTFQLYLCRTLYSFIKYHLASTASTASTDKNSLKYFKNYNIVTPLPPSLCPFKFIAFCPHLSIIVTHRDTPAHILIYMHTH